MRNMASPGPSSSLHVVWPFPHGLHTSSDNMMYVLLTDFWKPSNGVLRVCRSHLCKKSWSLCVKIMKTQELLLAKRKMNPANSINNKSRGGKQKIQTRLTCNLIEAESPVVLFSRLLVIIDKYVQ